MGLSQDRCRRRLIVLGCDAKELKGEHNEADYSLRRCRRSNSGLVVERR